VRAGKTFSRDRHESQKGSHEAGASQLSSNNTAATQLKFLYRLQQQNNRSIEFVKVVDDAFIATKEGK
jgi:hypothetical protein